ncbi:Nn.00g042740.m01.CDS01 [Neocucurbitaria sp. VM-36]
MAEAASQAPFFSLPTELRLYIASYVLEQSPSTGFVPSEGPYGPLPQQIFGFSLSKNYRAATNLSILLVCRQFRKDFTPLAFKKTIFLLPVHPARSIVDTLDVILRNVRKLAIQCDNDLITSWYEYPFDKECLKLDELHVAMRGPPDTIEMIRLLRRLKNVKRIRFIKAQEQPWMYLSSYNSLIASVLKEDHYQRYDAPDAPNVESTWWTWSLNKEEQHFTLLAQEPKPVMEEEKYMGWVKPLVDDVMMWAERLQLSVRAS